MMKKVFEIQRSNIHVQKVWYIENFNFPERRWKKLKNGIESTWKKTKLYIEILTGENLVVAALR